MEAGIGSGSRQAVVVDANLAIALALKMPTSEQAAALFEQWRAARAPIYAPMLWEYEVVSTLRKAVALGYIVGDSASTALDQLPRLGVTCVAPDVLLHRAALIWAERLGHTVACDAQYLALAERLHAQFWTADRKLARRAESIGVGWVHALGAG